MIKAIETSYAGCRFRSRLEARWAVFFDKLSIRWEYERQGFELPSGRYLPDFWLPDAQAWVEIKGQQPTQQEQVKLIELAHSVCEQGHRVRLLAGDIPREVTWKPTSGPDSYFGIPSSAAVPGYLVIHPELAVFKAVSDYQVAAPKNWILKQGLWVPGGNWHNQGDLNAALTAARSARFEHGQHGA